jgi:hypothetical protein
LPSTMGGEVIGWRPLGGLNRRVIKGKAHFG